MDNGTTLRRSKSLKSALSRRTSKRVQDTDPVPLLPTPGKQSLVEFRVTTGDLLRANSVHASRTPSHRSTWPTYPREVKPGTYSFDSVPTLVRTQWEFDRARRPASQWSRGSTDRRSGVTRAFEKLPTEVLHCILDHLRALHLARSSINAKRLQADFKALCLTNKQLQKVAREHLYREIWAPSHSGVPSRSLKWLSRPSSSRLEQLLRALKEAPPLKALVRCIRVSSELAKKLESEIAEESNDQRGSKNKSGAIHILSEVINQCQNLEVLLGFAPTAVQSAKELHASLASCSNLKSHVWRLATRWQGTSILEEPGAFLGYHKNWNQLQTMVVFQEGVGWDLAPGTISAVLRRLPSLRHLILSGLYPSDFHNGTLLMLPPLKSLRLEELHGVTDQGLEQLAHTRTAFSLQKLTLCGLEVTSLRTIQVLFSEIVHLKRFTLHQNTSPELAQTSMMTSTNFCLGSNSLESLHWDVMAQSHSTTILANSIASGRFPNLRKVKVPADYDGAIQRLCRPIARRPLTSQDLDALEIMENHWGYFRSLPYSQIQAQIRISESRKQPSFNVVVQDEEEAVQHRHFIGSYLGNIASNIEYSLEPAVDGTTVALAETQLATNPGFYLRTMPAWQEYCARPDGTRELMLDLDMLF